MSMSACEVAGISPRANISHMVNGVRPLADPIALILIVVRRGLTPTALVNLQPKKPSAEEAAEGSGKSRSDEPYLLVSTSVVSGRDSRPMTKLMVATRHPSVSGNRSAVPVYQSSYNLGPRTHM
jgi:hypothetical protein